MARTPRQDPDRELTARAQSALDSFVARKDAPGISHVVVSSEAVVFEGHAGLVDVTNGRAVGSQTLYMANSTTKALTAIAVMQLVERGEMHLDAPLSQYIEHPYGDSVTVAMALAHTGGLPNPMPLNWFFVEGEALDYDAAYRATLEDASELAGRPGRRYRYSNIGYWLLGRAMERVTGQDFAEVLRTLVFDPLGISDVSASFVLPPTGRLATGHSRKWGIGNALFFLMTPKRYWAESKRGWSRFRRLVHHGPAYGGLYVSARGFATVLADLLKVDSLLLSSESKARLFEEQRTETGEVVGGTLGWVTGKTAGVRYFGKQGGALGFHGNIRIYPDLGLASVYFANATRVSAGPIDRLSDELDEPFLRYWKGE